VAVLEAGNLTLQIRGDDACYWHVTSDGRILADASWADQAETFTMAVVDGGGSFRDGAQVRLWTEDGRLVWHRHGRLRASAPIEGVTDFTVVVARPPSAAGHRRETPEGARTAFSDGTQFLLKTASDCFVEVSEGGELDAQCHSADTAATLTAETPTESVRRVLHVTLRSPDGGDRTRYMQALNGGGDGVNVESASGGVWETFDLLPADRQERFSTARWARDPSSHPAPAEAAPGSRVHLRTMNGHYIGVGATDRLNARSRRPGERETFTLCLLPTSVPGPGAGSAPAFRLGQSVGLYASNGKFVRRERSGHCGLIASSDGLTSSETFVIEQSLSSEPVPTLTPNRVKELGERHLADLMEGQRLAEVKIGPRVRRVSGPSPHWDLRRERLRRACRPDTRLGRRLAWWKIIKHPEHLWDWRIISPVLVVAVVIANTSVHMVPEATVGIGVVILLGVSAAGAFVFLRNEFLLSPWRAWRLRRRIMNRPALVLPSAPRQADGRLVPNDDPLENRLIPRPELFEEVMPGILRRRNRDVQVIIGEPGSGKTMALVYLAREVARIGLVPVLVPLRTESADNIEQAASEALARQLRDQFYPQDEIETLWFWLRERNRLIVLTDDIDQLKPELQEDETERRDVTPREPGFVLRRTLDRLANHDLPIIVTARPAGIPAGVAASSIDLEELDENRVIETVGHIAREDPGAQRDAEVTDQALAVWVRQGHLTETPFYLELLASLSAAGRCPELTPDSGTPGQVRRAGAGHWQWNPLWVRFRLLESYYDALVAGRVRGWLGIQVRERRSTLEALEGAALGMLRATAQEGRAAGGVQDGPPHDKNLKVEALKVDEFTIEALRIQASRADALNSPRRRRLEQFVDPDDRTEPDRRERTKVSVHEVVDTGQRLRVIDHDQIGELQFRHRIMQAYLAARRLVDRDRDEIAASKSPTQDVGSQLKDWLERRLDDLLDRRHPEKLTTQMTLAFAAIRAHELGEAGIYGRIMERLLEDSRMSASACEAAPVTNAGARAPAPLRLGRQPSARGCLDDDPMGFFDPQARTDPDHALTLLTTAARIAQVTDGEDASAIVDMAKHTSGATRWTKIDAIKSVAGLRGCPERWQRIWEFARDGDYRVRRAASDEIRADAAEAYKALHDSIATLIVRAAARDALDQSLGCASPPGAVRTNAGEFEIGQWDEDRDVRALKALGWILPAIVSGLREVKTQTTDGSDAGQDAYTGDARRSLERFVALAFTGGHDDFEASVALGFKDDAMRHAEDPEHRISGPGRVAANRRLAAEVGLINADSWYSRLLLHQAVALYAIVGAHPRETLDLMAWHLHPAREPHPFVRDAGWLGRRALERSLLGSEWWKGLIWRNEGEVVSHRATVLDDCAAQLVADVTLLLNLTDSRGEDSRAQAGDLDALPYCLSGSPDRREILGAGCPGWCGSGLCPYQEPPPDEPSAHRAFSRAFCRQQRELSERRRPSWQRIREENLSNFWREMERRTRG
jgi:NACHT domain